MKRKALCAALGSMMLLTGCGGSKIPKNEKLQKNMEAKSYTVKITEDESLGSIFTAKKDSDFLYVYRLNTAQDTADFYGMFENGSTEYDRLYQFQDDSRLGNVVICATETAFADSGIIITEEDQKQ